MFFRPEWLTQIKRYQSELFGIHIDNLKPKHGEWFEYLFDEKNPRDSKFRCRFCHNNYDKFNFAIQYRPALADAKLYSDAKGNLRAIRDHATNKGNDIDFTVLNDDICIIVW